MLSLELWILAVVVAVVGVWGTHTIVTELRQATKAAREMRTLEIMRLFAPGLAVVDSDPRALLVWQPLAKAARELFPSEIGALDRVWAGPFPFSVDRLQSAHAQWTADWLSWERAHDAEYKKLAVEAESSAYRDQTSAQAADATLRARLDVIEREKLERYQRRYEEYIRVAKALQALYESKES